MKKILLLIFLLGSNYLFAQPLTSTPAGCAINVLTEYRIYQITTASFGSRPTYQGTGGVRYTTWTNALGGVDQTRLTCLTLNTVTANACYVKTGLGSTSINYTSGTTTTFTVNPGTAYNESGSGSCTNVPIDDYAWLLVLTSGLFGGIALKNKKNAHFIN